MNSTSSQLPDKPRPQSPPEHEPWWRALTEHRLLAQQCSGCQRLRLYPRPMCDACYSLKYDWVEISGVGSVHSWAISYHAFNAGFKKDIPYLTVTVDLQDGLRLHAPMLGPADQKMALGMRVEVGFDDVDETYTRIFFKRAEQHK
ncbi:MAG: Zn-ribbon domain-containing OB-fold protein [Gammaproteobacteria bacterium]